MSSGKAFYVERDLQIDAPEVERIDVYSVFGFKYIDGERLPCSREEAFAAWDVCVRRNNQFTTIIHARGFVETWLPNGILQRKLPAYLDLMFMESGDHMKMLGTKNTERKLEV